MKLKRESLQPSIVKKLRLDENGNQRPTINTKNQKLVENRDDDLSFEESFIGNYINSNYVQQPQYVDFSNKPTSLYESNNNSSNDVIIDENGNRYEVDNSSYVDIDDNDLYGEQYAGLSSAYKVDVNALINEAMTNGSASTNVKLK